MARHDLIVEFSPGSVPLSTTRSWIDISTRILEAEWGTGRTRDLEQWPVCEATLLLDNYDRLFDPEYAAGTYFGDLLPRVPFRIRTDDGGGAVDAYYGFVENGWEQAFSGPASGTCTVRLVDLLGVLPGYKLPSVYDVEVLADNPVAYWPLDETRGLGMRDATGQHADGIYIPGTTSLSSDEESETGATVRGLKLDESHWGSLQDASVVLETLPVTYEAAFRPVDHLDTSLADYNKAIFRMGTGNPDEGGTFYISYFPSNVTGRNWSINGASRINSGNNVVLGDRHPLGAEQTARVRHAAYRHTSGADAHIYLDGVDDSDSVSNILTGLAAAPGIVIGSADYQSFGATNVAWPSFLAGVAIYDTDIGTTRIAAHAEALISPLDGQRSDQRIGWVLDQVGVPAGLRNLDLGWAVLGPADTKARDALEYIREIEATEQGAFYVDHRDGGKLRFRNRYALWEQTRSITSQATISDDPAASFSTVVRCEPDQLSVEPAGVSSIINQATVNWGGGEEVAEDATSITAYGPRGKTINSISSSANLALSLAQWIILLNAEPTTRIRGVGIDLGAADAGFDLVMPLRIGDMVTYRSKPLNIGDPIVQELTIEGIKHQVGDALDWNVDIFVSIALGGDGGISLFTLGTSELNGTDILGF